jgi:hypothetical protein
MNQQELISKIEALEQRVAQLEQAQQNKRDRGPASEREMTEEDAFRVKFGDMKDLKHKDAAEQLKISYGQVYSARGGYTFKQVKEDWKPKAKAQPVTPAAQQ